MSKHVQGKPERCMTGEGARYDTTAGRVVRGHSLVASLVVLLGRRCPLPPQLYRQKAVADADPDKSGFQSKVDLLVAPIRTLVSVSGTQTCVLVDAWYTCRTIWRAALQRTFAIIGGLRVNR